MTKFVQTKRRQNQTKANRTNWKNEWKKNSHDNITCIHAYRQKDINEINLQHNKFVSSNIFMWIHFRSINHNRPGNGRGKDTETDLCISKTKSKTFGREKNTHKLHGKKCEYLHPGYRCRLDTHLQNKQSLHTFLQIHYFLHFIQLRHFSTAAALGIVKRIERKKPGVTEKSVKKCKIYDAKAIIGLNNRQNAKINISLSNGNNFSSQEKRNNRKSSTRITLHASKRASANKKKNLI